MDDNTPEVERTRKSEYHDVLSDTETNGAGGKTVRQSDHEERVRQKQTTRA